MNVAIVGSRDYLRLDRVSQWVAANLDTELDVLVSGGARGVDLAAEAAFRSLGGWVVSYRVFDRGDGWFQVEVHQFDGDRCVDVRAVRNDEGRPLAYRSFGRAAFDRNGYIVEHADKVVAFWNGKSRGTRHSINYAEMSGTPFEVFTE